MVEMESNDFTAVKWGIHLLHLRQSSKIGRGNDEQPHITESHQRQLRLPRYENGFLWI